MYNKKLKGKKEEKKLIVGRKFQGGAGKTGHGVKFVDARTRTDQRGEQRAEKLRKKAKKSGSSKPKGPVRAAACEPTHANPRMRTHAYAACVRRVR